MPRARASHHHSSSSGVFDLCAAGARVRAYKCLSSRISRWRVPKDASREGDKFNSAPTTCRCDDDEGPELFVLVSTS